MDRAHTKLAARAFCWIAAAAAFAAVLLVPATVRASDTLTPLAKGMPGSVPARVACCLTSGSALAGSPLTSAAASGPGNSGNAQAGTTNLTYHGGPVMHTNTTYAIFWSPPSHTIPGTYEDTINQFFADVAHDSGMTTNVYSADPQYTDGTGAAQYSSLFGGSYVDSSTPIPDDCSSQYSGTGVTVNGCVLDSDLQAEVSRALSANPTWSAGLGAQFFVFTPQNVGSCSDTTSRDCAYTSYCAYHWDFTQGSTPVIYANMPYSDSSGVGAPGVCSSGEQPNGNWADDTLNVTSHEHNEAITDPLVSAWYDSAGNEIGDKCAWMFGATLGGTPGAEWNQVINGHHYYLQEEWNNATSGCVQRVPGSAPVVSGFSPSSGPDGTAVTITGSNLSGATSVEFNGASAKFTGTGTSISATVPSGAASGPITVTTPAGTGTSGTSFTVTLGSPPGISSFTPGSGSPGTGVTISGSDLTGATSVKFAGTSASFTVSSATTISTSVPAGAKSGTITVTTPGGTATSTQSFTVLVPDFTIAVTPPSETVRRGSDGSYTVTITDVNGFAGNVQLSVSGLPGRVSASFSPGTILAPGTTSTLTVATRSNSRTGSSTLTVTGTSGALRHTATALLTLD